MKHVQACLSAREDRKSSFHHYGGPVRLCKPVYVRERPDNAVFTSEKLLLSRCRAGYLPEKIEKAVFTAVEYL